MARVRRTTTATKSTDLPRQQQSIKPIPCNIKGTLRALVLELFDKDYTHTPYKGRFGVARPHNYDDINEDEKIKAKDDKDDDDDETSFLDLTLVWEILHDNISVYLAPHEVLAVFQSNKQIWHSIPHKNRKRSILQSIFLYFRISNEAAQEVKETHGWKAFAPRLIQIGQFLVDRVYGKDLEPDRAHCAMIGEQACFWNRNGRRTGNLLGQALNLHDRDDSDDEEEETKEPIPTLEELKQVYDRHTHWGAIDPCLSLHIGENKRAWLEGNHKWMMENSDQLIKEDQDEATRRQMMYYKRRLDQGLHPLIWIMKDEGVYLEWVLYVGPNREQIVGTYSSFYDSFGEGSVKNNFSFCFPFKSGALCNSLAEFFVAYGFTPHGILDPTPTLCVAIWLMRRGIAPFTRPDIDWMALIDNDEPERCYTCSSKDKIEKGRLFLKDAVSSPLFGPADLEKFLF